MVNLGDFLPSTKCCPSSPSYSDQEVWDALEASHKKKFLREMEDGLEKERNLVSAGGESLPFRYKLLKIVLLHGFIREIFERQKPLIQVSQLLQSACLSSPGKRHRGELSHWSDNLNYCPLIGRDWAERGELELSNYGLRYVKCLLVLYFKRLVLHDTENCSKELLR